MMNPESRLPAERLWNSTCGHLVLKLAVAIALLGAVNGVVGLLLRTVGPNPNYRIVGQKWDMLAELEEPKDWVILGDSACMHGVDPQIVSAQLGGSSINLCTYANLLVIDNAWMLQDYINRFGAPRRGVIVVHTYDVWKRDSQPDPFAQIALGRVPMNASPSLGLSLKDRTKLMLSQMAPLFFQDVSVREMATNPRRTVGQLLTDASREGYDVDEQGFLPVTQPDPDRVRDDIHDHLDLVTENEFELMDVNRAALDEIAKLADREGFDVFLANAPVYDRLAEHPDWQHYFSDAWATLGQFAAEHERVHVALDTPVTFPATEMENVDHVTVPGAQKFTRQLVDAIQQHIVLSSEAQEFLAYRTRDRE